MPTQRAPGHMTKPTLLEAHYEFRAGIKELNRRLLARIPMSKLNIENLGLDRACAATDLHQHWEGDGAPEGVISDVQYRYCY